MFVRWNSKARVVAVYVSAVAGTGCAAGSHSTFNGSGDAASNGAGGSSGAGLTSESSVGAGVGGGSSAGGTGASGPGTFVYLHDATTLYALDPNKPTGTPKVLGMFDCISSEGPETSMTDFAVSHDGQMWGISSKVAHRLVVKDGMVHCVTSTPLTSAKSVAFYALTFAPVGVLDPNKEVLIAGNTAGELWAIDENGKLTPHGSFGVVPPTDGLGHPYNNAGTAWPLSGDHVFHENNG